MEKVMSGVEKSNYFQLYLTATKSYHRHGPGF